MSINVQFPLRKGKKGAFETNDTTIDAVTDDLRVLLLTNYGERPIHYDFGCNLRGIVFEQGAGIEDLITAAIEKWMPFVSLVEVRVDDSTTDQSVRDHELMVHLRFRVGQVEGSLKQKIRN